MYGRRIHNDVELPSFNSDTLEEVMSAGGFGEVYFYLTERFQVHTGYGIDNPRDSDLAPTQFLQNQTYFTDFIWDERDYHRRAGRPERVDRGADRHQWDGECCPHRYTRSD